MGRLGEPAPRGRHPFPVGTRVWWKDGGQAIAGYVAAIHSPDFVYAQPDETRIPYLVPVRWLNEAYEA